MPKLGRFFRKASNRVDILPLPLQLYYFLRKFAILTQHSLIMLKDFFKNLFGGGLDAKPNDGFVEDGADKPNDQSIGEIVAPAPVQQRTATRGIDDVVVEDIDASNVIGEVVAGVNPANIGGVRITRPRYFWCLDNGHGRLQPGKRSPVFPDGKQLFEWELTRDIVKRMLPKLQAAGVQYFVVVPETEVSDFLKERVARANAKVAPMGLPKIFVSIHANAAGSGADWNPAEGLETFHLAGSATGKKIATVFQKYLVGTFPAWKNRGVKEEAHFYVLSKTTMPAVLTENGFYTNQKQCTELLDPNVRQRIADAHVAAILEIEQKGL